MVERLIFLASFYKGYLFKFIRIIEAVKNNEGFHFNFLGVSPEVKLHDNSQFLLFGRAGETVWKKMVIGSSPSGFPLQSFCLKKAKRIFAAIPHAAVLRLTKLSSFIIILFTSQFASAQNTTISNKEKEKTTATTHKVMIIPFEPKLYNSEIDYMINKETKLSGKEIKFKFRDGLNEQLYKAFKNSKYGVVDLMEDTVKYKKDVEAIYSHLNYEYMKVPNQEHYKPPVKEKSEKQVEKGQVKVETNSEARFMNAKIDNAKLVPTLYGKFKTDIFIFINQLDIKAAMSSTELAGGGGEYRKLVVHYTVYTYDAKEINSGIAEQEFPATLNDPSKIIAKYMAKVAETINARVVKALAPTK